MDTVFTTEEKVQLHSIIDDYKTVYERASFLAAEMTKMEDEMKELLEKMDNLKTTEANIYNTVAERTGNDLITIRKNAAVVVLEKLNAKEENLVENDKTNE